MLSVPVTLTAWVLAGSLADCGTLKALPDESHIGPGYRLPTASTSAHRLDDFDAGRSQVAALACREVVKTRTASPRSQRLDNVSQ
jgi:hypothetical protein